MASNLETGQSARSLPGKATFGGYLYVVEFNNATLKVGRTSNPVARIEHHEGQASAFGIERLRVWVSDLHIRPEATERLLISAATKIGRGVRRLEYIEGADFKEVVRAAKRLSYIPVDQESEEAAQKERFLALKVIWGTANSATPHLGPVTAVSELWALMGDIFGRGLDGYQWPMIDRDNDSQAVFESMYEIADLLDVEVESVLEMTPIDMFARTVITLVQAESDSFAFWALKSGRADLLTSYAELFEEIQCIPS